jgi:hypothetical protein
MLIRLGNKANKNAMNTKTKLIIFLPLVLALAASLSFSVAAPGQASQSEAIVLSSIQPQPTAPIQMYVRGYVYPIAELNNCSSKQACFDFCEQLANMPVCAMFAQRQGMMKPEMVAVTQRLAVGLMSNSSFAGCNTANACVRLCDQASNAGACADLASSYQLSSRVLGASDGAAGTSSANAASAASANPEVWGANPYANLNQNYSNPALNNYIATNSGSGCAPLDMACMSKSGQQANGRVLARSIEETGGGVPKVELEQNGDGAGSGFSIGDETPTKTDPVKLSDCVNNSSGSLATFDPATALPEDVKNIQDNLNNCQQDFGQAVKEDAASTQQQTIGGILQFQDCIAGSTNMAVDVRRCINQELR